MGALQFLGQQIVVGEVEAGRGDARGQPGGVLLHRRVRDCTGLWRPLGRQLFDTTGELQRDSSSRPCRRTDKNRNPFALQHPLATRTWITTVRRPSDSYGLHHPLGTQGPNCTEPRRDQLWQPSCRRPSRVGDFCGPLHPCRTRRQDGTEPGGDAVRPPAATISRLRCGCVVSCFARTPNDSPSGTGHRYPRRLLDVLVRRW